MMNVTYKRFLELQEKTEEIVLQLVVALNMFGKDVSVYRAVIVLQREDGIYDSVILDGEECFYPIGAEMVSTEYYVWCDKEGSIFENQSEYDFKFKEMIKPISK